MALTNVRVLQAGMSFGELALMEKKPRAATIICREKCYFGVLDKTSFDNILSKNWVDGGLCMGVRGEGEEETLREN